MEKIYSDIIAFKQEMKENTRLLGLDVGRVRIGYAFSDKGKFLASSQGVINLKKQKLSASFFSDLILKEEIFGIVVGYPLQMDGEKGESCMMVDKFIDKYLKKLNQPIYLQDERLSSSAVNRFLKEMEVTRKQSSELIDKASAEYILQCALDKLNFIL